MDEITFVRKVQDAIESQMPVDRNRTEELIGAVFSALSVRLTATEGRNFISQLPTALKELWYWKALFMSARWGLWDEKQVVKLSKGQFLTTIQIEGGLETPEEADFVARCVFHVLKEAISPGEVQDAAGQLPSGLREWVLAA